jgi:hypothetical protein
MAIGASTLADIFEPRERGTKVSCWALVVLIDSQSNLVV